MVGSFLSLLCLSMILARFFFFYTPLLEYANLTVLWLFLCILCNNSMLASLCHLTKARVIGEEEGSIEKMPSQDWTVGKPVGYFISDCCRRVQPEGATSGH